MTTQEPPQYEELPQLSIPAIDSMPTVECWSTSTDLAGTDKERKTYFLTLYDGVKTLQFSLEHYAEDNRIVAVPYSPPDYDYMNYDYDGDEEDYESLGDHYYDDEYDDDEDDIWYEDEES